MKREHSKEEFTKFIKFALTGILNTAVDFAVYTVLVGACAANLYAAQAAGYACGTLNSYLLNRSWTFHSKKKFFSRELFKFIVVNLITLGISFFGMYFLKQWLGLGDILLKLPLVVLTFVVNFLLSRLWVFS